VLIFKILVLQTLYSLSNEGCEFQIKDRLSFQRFLGLGLDGAVPDATTVWLFRERFVKAKAMDKLFARFDAALTTKVYLAMGGRYWMRRLLAQNCLKHGACNHPIE
jgi:transposase, IS5 family